MERCLQCNSTLKPDEKECFTCGSAVPEKNPKKQFSERFRMVVNGLFLLFAVLTVASLFVDSLGSFWKFASGLVVIYLVRSSATTMFETGKKG